MRLPAPRVIVIDDEREHLEGLVQGFNQCGMGCLPVHFKGDMNIAPCSQVRVIFVDLHLSVGPPGDHARDFSVIGGLIEDMIQPSGPYFIVLWTRYPDQANKLHSFLAERLQNVATPFTVSALDKSDHLGPQGGVRNPETLVSAIKRVVVEQPQIGALLNWEGWVLSATADTVLSITKMGESAAGGVAPSEKIGRLMRHLAVGAVGGEHVEKDRFRAVNDALLPILADRIASIRSQDTDNELWRNALEEAGAGSRLTRDEAAKLNRLLHIAPSTDHDNGGERGAVIALPEEFLGKAFEETFDLASERAMTDQFRCMQPEEDKDRPCWVLVQTQAACDHAQNQPGPLPFHLGLCLPASRVRKGTPPAALWRSPCFEYESGVSFLHVSARFQVSWPRNKVREEAPLFRLREQLLNDLIYHLHGYGARPGIISFPVPKEQRTVPARGSSRMPER